MTGGSVLSVTVSSHRENGTNRIGALAMCSNVDDPTYEREPYVPASFPCTCRECNCYARVPSEGPCARCKAGNHADRPRLPERPKIEYRYANGRVIVTRPAFVRDIPRTDPRREHHDPFDGCDDEVPF